MSGPAAPGAPPLTARGLRERILAGALTAETALEVALEAIATRDGELRAFREVHGSEARERARSLDQERAAGAPPGPLFGVPVALKANLCKSGWATDCGSRILEGWRAPYTATAVERLEAAGAVCVGTTNLDEFAMGSSGENSAFAASANPRDPARVPGGSSSGSAAAVGAGLVPLALGSDTGGSVRQPAAFTGVVGFKPTWGAVSRRGLVAFASSLDQIGPLARDVEDAALCFSVLRGRDPRDATSRDVEPPALPLVAPRAPRLGVPRVWRQGLEPAVAEAFEATLARLGSAGASVVDVELLPGELALACYYVVATAEASSNLARHDGVRYGRRVEGDGTLRGLVAASRSAGFGREVQRRILLGTYALSSGYQDEWFGQAARVRRALANELDALFERVDLLVGPTTPGVAFERGSRTGDPLAMYGSDVLTVPANLAGLPAISVPCPGVEGLPVGFQIAGPRGADARVLAAARLVEGAA